MVTITRDNAQYYIDQGILNPNGKIDLNKTKTAGDNVHRWVTLQEALDKGYDFRFDISTPKKKEPKLKEGWADEYVVTAKPTKKEKSEQFKSTTMAAYYDRIKWLTSDNLERSIKRDKEDRRIEKSNYWQGILNLLSPSQYIGSSIDYFQGERPFLEGVWYGNSGVVPEQFAGNHPYWTFGINTLIDVALGYGSGKLYNYANTSIVKSGTETPVVTYKPFSLNVEKHSTIKPSEMHVRNHTPGVVKSTFKGIDSDGLYVYTQPRMWFPKNELFTKFTFNKAIKPMLKKGYHKVTHPNLQGIALQNKKWSISDFGNYGEGQVGWTWWGSPKIGDAAWETIPEFLIAMEKKGGKVNV